MRHRFSDHARERAQERYGRDFDPVELNDIFFACISGKAFCGRLSDDGTTAYRLTLDCGLVVCPVMARQKTFIVTFLPSDYFTAGHRRRAGQESGLLKQIFAGAKKSLPRPYRRERINVNRLLEDF